MQPAAICCIELTLCVYIYIHIECRHIHIEPRKRTDMLLNEPFLFDPTKKDWIHLESSGSIWIPQRAFFTNENRRRTDRSTRGSWEHCQNRPAKRRLPRGLPWIFFFSINDDKWTIIKNSSGIIRSVGNNNIVL